MEGERKRTAREMNKSVKCLSCRGREFNSQNPHKKLGVVVSPYYLNTEKVQT